ncbi:unnamed protein product [Auanema sp. JU1783]|nr:unnamed protein product [Auanema sp. JU1783]
MLVHTNTARTSTIEQTDLIQQPKIRQIRIPGDIIIGGVFPVHSTSNNPEDPCGEIAETRGVHRVEAMLFALDLINSNPNILPDHKLGALIVDSCSNPAYALNQSLDFVRDLIDSTDQSELVCSDGSRPFSPMLYQKNRIAAVVGGSYSSVSVQVANLLRLFQISQVSPASTNSDLSDKTRFEYFARTVPSDAYQAMAMADIAAHFLWTYVSLVYSADEYGELGADAFKKEARKKGICIAIEERLQMKRRSFEDSVENLIKKLQVEKPVGARVVVLFVGSEYIPELLRMTAEKNQKAFNKKQNIIWLASESWDRNNPKYTKGNNREIAEGAIVLTLTSKKVPAFEEYFLDMKPGTPKFERNKWMKELWIQKYNCKFDIDEDSVPSEIKRCEDIVPSKIFQTDDKVQFVIDAMYAISYALHSYRKDQCSNTTKWMERTPRDTMLCDKLKSIDGDIFYKKYLMNVQFENMFGDAFRFTPNGDGPAAYTILNFRTKHKPGNGSEESGNILNETESDYVEIGHWSENNLTILDDKLKWRTGFLPLSLCSLPCSIGSRKQLIKDEQCCWACIKCEHNEYLVNETHCSPCEQGWWPDERTRSFCYDLSIKNLEFMVYSSWYSIIPMFMAAIGMIATIFTIFIYIKYNDTPVVKASGRELTYIILLSMLMCYGMTFVLVAKPSTIVCALKRTGIGFSFSCMYSAMFVKTNRIARIFSEATRTARRPRCITPLSQVFLCGILAGLQLFGSLIWLYVKEPGTRFDFPSKKQVVLTCNVPDHHFLFSLCYAAILVILCTVYAIRTRTVPENFNETKFIGFTMYTTCVIWISWIFFYFCGGTVDFKMHTTSLCVSISMSANVVFACIFSPKVWIILFEKEKNVHKPEGQSMLSKRSMSNSRTRLYSGAGPSSITEEPKETTGLLNESRKRSIAKGISTPSDTSAQDTLL